MKKIVLLAVLILSYGFQLFAQQAAEIRIDVPSFHLGVTPKPSIKDPTRHISHILLTLGSDGLIFRIQNLSNEELTNPVGFVSLRTGTTLELSSTQSQGTYDSVFKTKLTWNNGTIIRSTVTDESSGTNSDEQTVTIHDAGNVIFDDEVLVFERLSKSIFGENPKAEETERTYLKYKDNVVDQYYKGFDNFRYVFTKNAGGTILVQVSENMGEGWINYDKIPPISIKGRNIHSGKRLINVLNYFLLQAYNERLAIAFFPQLFSE